MFRKILMFLPKTWDAKVTAIQEAKDLTKLPLEELIGSLMTHEIIMEEHLEDESKKKKSIALNTISLELEDEDDLDEDDIVYFSRKYKNFIKRKKCFKKYLSTQKVSKGEKSKKDEVICYECKKLAHIRTDCPFLKSSKKSKRKAMKATWDDSSESESEVEETANLGLMVQSDKEDEHDDEVTLEPPSIEELFENFENVQNDLEKLSSKYVVLKKKYNVLSSENKSLLDKIACFKENVNKQIEELNVSSDKHIGDCNEKDALLDKVRFLEHDSCEKDNLIKVLKENELNVLQDLDKAKETIKKLTIGAQRLDKIIEVGKSYGDKRSLGYIDESSTLSSKTTFVKASPIVPKFNMCLTMFNLVLCLYVIIVVLKVTLDLNALN
ncbi:zf-CCHC domain-containing protein/UBN2 domain-containing protein [Cucumis melo var. makuwa]|uniref:Zf-CCHC domain-containing protein/UBN2 domain-containing protein n=1 Tax=Cucumis melo var. makuwa TaxID=1194695 RepID=A0A5A7TRZ7_CUCMM|nr:zf-CCHC domain-containing protein/UBN2 domain-containing protein [Cucumis melo var. makuwa]TYK00208.1 zf-CCHC domain-containing protein/UBN2 domain-containing protein [Cucumis melo var. makuwa]